ncbi:hypothetical protein PN416_08540 [Halorubrum ezzemoulense]|uniref:hypothetical protein n=1 Tax=Halorubrum ezzemoulense TaxID=337243 RepID=UPI00232C151C|nr:hypothetical protein [Halorubrum ezzemoulense]MDB2269819.1 hypothetical protein [Halorubrum ezzemoulense]MDB9279555.1 hypothetical protein [Halorubrum ezzemoulense]MDB9283490.1 hypothetical protein [Halorubrum ezzemoulense]
MAYLLVGGNRLSDTGQSVGYVDVIKITAQTTITINTRTIGTNQPTGGAVPATTPRVVSRSGTRTAM